MRIDMDRRLLLLGLLHQQEMHGYQINEFIEENIPFCVDLKRPTAYYILDKLAQEGLVKVEQVQEGNRPPRRVYHITEAGKAHFLELLRRNLSDHSPSYHPINIGITFMNRLPRDELVNHLREKREKLMFELKALQTAVGYDGPLQQVLDRNQRLLYAELDWLDSVMQNLKES